MKLAAAHLLEACRPLVQLLLGLQLIDVANLRRLGTLLRHVELILHCQVDIVACRQILCRAIYRIVHFYRVGARAVISLNLDLRLHLRRFILESFHFGFLLLET